MIRYDVVLEMISDVLPGSGEGTPGYVDSEIQKDNRGLPVVRASVFKGNLRECAENAASWEGIDESLIYALFGYEGSESATQGKKLYFSDLKLPIIKECIDDVTNKEIFSAVTGIRANISIDNGVAKDGALRYSRVIKKGVSFSGTIDVPVELDSKEEILLVKAASIMKHIGSSRNRGLGEVSCRLYKDDEDLFKKYFG